MNAKELFTLKYACVIVQNNTLSRTLDFLLQGYGFISSRTGCQHLRQIRGDNYCAIRAVLFQALAGRLPIMNLFASEKITKLEKVGTEMQNIIILFISVRRHHTKRQMRRVPPNKDVFLDRL